MFNYKSSIPLLALTAMISGCGVSDGESTDADTLARDNFDTFAMLKNIADNVVVPQYEATQTPLATLETHIGSYCDSLGTANAATAREAAQSAWVTTLETWQATEPALFGPAADNSNNLRNRVYAYGDQRTDPCGVDLGVVRSVSNDDAINSLSNASRGLGALEYLLFSDDLTTQCPSNVSDTQGWDDLSEDVRQAQRCAYAEIVVANVETSLNRIVDAWKPTTGNFRSTFINPDVAGASLREVSDSMIIFVDQELKDKRLGAPLGICTSSACRDYETVEATFSATSYNSIKAGFLGLEAVLFGKSGTSFDDLIASVNQTQINTRFQQNINNAVTLINSLDSNLADDVAAATADAQAESECDLAISRPNDDSSYPACRIYGYVKAISDSLKTDFLAATNLDIPDRAQSDND